MYSLLTLLLQKGGLLCYYSIIVLLASSNNQYSSSHIVYHDAERKKETQTPYTLRGKVSKWIIMVVTLKPHILLLTCFGLYF